METGNSWFSKLEIEFTLSDKFGLIQPEPNHSETSATVIRLSFQ